MLLCVLLPESSSSLAHNKLIIPAGTETSYVDASEVHPVKSRTGLEVGAKVIYRGWTMEVSTDLDRDGELKVKARINITSGFATFAAALKLNRTLSSLTCDATCLRLF